MEVDRITASLTKELPVLAIANVNLGALVTISLRLRSDALVVRMCSAYVFLANVEFIRVTTESWGIAFPCMMRGATF